MIRNRIGRNISHSIYIHSEICMIFLLHCILVMATKVPQIAILGAGIFVKNQYLPRLSEISHLFHLKAIWSRTQVMPFLHYCCIRFRSYSNLIGYFQFIFSAQESATAAVDIAGKNFPGVECKWGDSGLEDILQDGSIDAVAVVLAGQNQVSYFSSLLSYLPFLTLTHLFRHKQLR